MKLWNHANSLLKVSVFVFQHHSGQISVLLERKLVQIEILVSQPKSLGLISNGCRISVIPPPCGSHEKRSPLSWFWSWGIAWCSLPLPWQLRQVTMELTYCHQDTKEKLLTRSLITSVRGPDYNDMTFEEDLYYSSVPCVPFDVL